MGGCCSHRIPLVAASLNEEVAWWKESHSYKNSQRTAVSERVRFGKDRYTGFRQERQSHLLIKQLQRWQFFHPLASACIHAVADI
jgi:hypothetical protein